MSRVNKSHFAGIAFSTKSRPSSRQPGFWRYSSIFIEYAFQSWLLRQNLAGWESVGRLANMTFVSTRRKTVPSGYECSTVRRAAGPNQIEGRDVTGLNLGGRQRQQLGRTRREHDSEITHFVVGITL